MKSFKILTYLEKFSKSTFYWIKINWIKFKAKSLLRID